MTGRQATFEMTLLGKIPSDVLQNVPPRNPCLIRPYRDEKEHKQLETALFWAAYCSSEHSAFETRHKLLATD